jgi:acid phosphatase (class A)
MKRVFPLCSLLSALLVLALAPLCAAGPYLHGVDPLVLLAPPSVPHTPEDLADRETAFRVYSARTPADVARGKAEHKVTIAAFASAIGPSFAPGKYPRLEALFKELEGESKPVVDEGKDHWKRLRPFVDDPVRFSDPGDPEPTASYPSGHSTRGTFLALVLAEVFPSRREALIAKGRLIGWTRVEIGVHTPQDIYAGRVLGQAMARAVLRDPAFQQELAAVRAEVAANP